MIDLALYQYLTTQADLDGQASEPFEASLEFGNETLADRNDVRRVIRDVIGKRIYAGRNIQIPNEGHTAATIRVVASDNQYHLRGESPCDQSTLQIDTWANGVGGALRAYQASQLIRYAIASYIGVWGTTYKLHVYSCTRTRAQTLPTSPEDGGSYWTHRYSQDFLINHSIQAVTFVGNALTAIASVSYQNDVLYLQVDDDLSTIPGGRTLQHVAWSISDGATLISFDGEPDVITTEANVTGVYSDLQIDNTEAGLTGEAEIKLTITDSTGQTAQHVTTISI